METQTSSARIGIGASAAGGNANGAHVAGTLWFAGWLFTVGFLQLVWWKVVLGLALWPYFLGAALGR